MPRPKGRTYAHQFMMRASLTEAQLVKLDALADEHGGRSAALRHLLDGDPPGPSARTAGSDRGAGSPLHTRKVIPPPARTPKVADPSITEETPCQHCGKVDLYTWGGNWECGSCNKLQ